MAYTRAEIVAKIAKYETAIDAALTGQNYSMDDGQTRISVSRASLAQLERQLSKWQYELQQIDDPSGISSLEVGR